MPQPPSAASLADSLSEARDCQRVERSHTDIGVTPFASPQRRSRGWRRLLALLAFGVTGVSLVATSAPPTYSVRHSATIDGPLLTLSAGQPEVYMRLQGALSADAAPAELPNRLDLTLHLRQHEVLPGEVLEGEDAGAPPRPTEAALVRAEVLRTSDASNDEGLYRSGVFLRDLSFASEVPLRCVSNECLDVTLRFSLAEPPFDNQGATVSWSIDLFGAVEVDEADEDADVSLPLDLALTRVEPEQP